MTPIQALRARVRASRYQRIVARDLGISDSYLSELLSGHRAMSARVAQRLGYRRQVAFRKMR